MTKKCKICIWARNFLENCTGLLKQNVFYPYVYTGTFERFVEELLDTEKFFSSLIDRYISGKDYEHVVKVWKVCKIKNTEEYCNLQLNSDIFLPCYIFQKFWSTCLQYYELDSCHYFNNVTLSRDATLKMEGKNDELLLDTDMFQIIEKSMRGGISYITQKYSKAGIGFIVSCDKKRII